MPWVVVDVMARGYMLWVIGKKNKKKNKTKKTEKSFPKQPSIETIHITAKYM